MSGNDEGFITMKERSAPEADAWMLGSLFFTWGTKLFATTRAKNKVGEELEEVDLLDLPPNDACGNSVAIFEKRWERFLLKANQNPAKSLSPKSVKRGYRASLSAVVWRTMFAAGVFRLINSIVQLALPFVIKELLSFVQTIDSTPIWVGIFWACLLGVIYVLKTVIENKFFWLVFRAGWRLRTVVATATYKKSLRLSASARQSMSQGKILNLMQLDAEKLERHAPMYHVFWDALFQIVGYCAIIYLYIGTGVFVGLGVMLVALPLQALIVFKLFQFQSRVVKHTDQRVKVVNEALQSMLAVKMAAWEEQFMKRIGIYRAEELKVGRQSLLMRSFMIAFLTSVPTFTAVAGLTYYGFTTDEVDAATLFASIQAFQSLRFPLFQLPMAFSTYTDSEVSLGRLSAFMALDENPSSKNNDALDVNVEKKLAIAESPLAVEINHGEFYWSPPLATELKPHLKVQAKQSKNPKNGVAQDLNDEATMLNTIPALDDVNISIPKGSLVGIVGAVGSGKSTLLNAILGELIQTQGTRQVNGSVAYAAQRAWVLNMTLKDNIIFGTKFDEDKYHKVLQVCQLVSDIKLLQNGDETIIGERGINLSGGQSQRVSVARAAYNNSDIVFLDDPLSALDPEVANDLFQECILGFMQGRTRVMVTNQLQFLEHCDFVIRMQGSMAEDGPDVSNTNSQNQKLKQSGRISSQGTFQELMTSDPDFAALMAKFQGSRPADDETDNSGPKKKLKNNAAGIMPGNAKKEFMQVEERAKGAVKFSQYWSYIKAGGACLFIFVLFLALLSQVVTVLNQFVLAFWANDPLYEKYSLQVYLGAYGLAAVLMGMIYFVQTYGFYYHGLRTSRRMHEKLVKGIFSAPMRFFDLTPLGRIVARFSRDTFSLDTEAPQIISFFFLSALLVVFSMVTIAAQIPPFLVMFPITAVVYGYLVSYYRPTARDAKRLEALTRSPVYAHFGETLGGLSSIRSYGKVDEFIKKNETNIDNNLKATYAVRFIERWLSVRLESLSALIATAAALLIVYAAAKKGLSPGLAGVAITMALTTTGMLGQTLRNFVQVETVMNSVERINFYSDDLETEASYTSSHPPDPSWPQRGEIVLRDVTMRYREDSPLVLKGVTVTIPAGTTCGVVGRTGSGKSSLFLTLLRIIERESGSIVIDGTDTATIGLHELRKKISIVPQNPVMFSGTVRSNLDPFENYKENDLWEALRQVSLDNYVSSLDGKLDAEVAEYGENFSQGQRQLLSMARTLLAQSKILLLDEATSSVDYETDAIIQATIRQSFTTCTILTIAHRVQTIIDNDNILVMAEGRVAEFGSPRALLDIEDSEFSKVISELGANAQENIRSRLVQL